MAILLLALVDLKGLYDICGVKKDQKTKKQQYHCNHLQRSQRSSFVSRSKHSLGPPANRARQGWLSMQCRAGVGGCASQVYTSHSCVGNGRCRQHNRSTGVSWAGMRRPSYHAMQERETERYRETQERERHRDERHRRCTTSTTHRVTRLRHPAGERFGLGVCWEGLGELGRSGRRKRAKENGAKEGSQRRRLCGRARRERSRSSRLVQ